MKTSLRWAVISVLLASPSTCQVDSAPTTRPLPATPVKPGQPVAFTLEPDSDGSASKTFTFDVADPGVRGVTVVFVTSDVRSLGLQILSADGRLLGAANASPKGPEPWWGSQSPPPRTTGVRVVARGLDRPTTATLHVERAPWTPEIGRAEALVRNARPELVAESATRPSDARARVERLVRELELIPEASTWLPLADGLSPIVKLANSVGASGAVVRLSELRLAAFEKFVPPSDLDRLQAKENVAIFRAMRGESEVARLMLREVLAERERSHDVDTDWADTAVNLATVELSSEKPGVASDFVKRALDAYRSKAATLSREMVSAMLRLSATERAQASIADPHARTEILARELPDDGAALGLKHRVLLDRALDARCYMRFAEARAILETLIAPTWIEREGREQKIAEARSQLLIVLALQRDWDAVRRELAIAVPEASAQAAGPADDLPPRAGSVMGGATLEHAGTELSLELACQAAGLPPEAGILSSVFDLFETIHSLGAMRAGALRRYAMESPEVRTAIDAQFRIVDDASLRIARALEDASESEELVKLVAMRDSALAAIRSLTRTERARDSFARESIAERVAARLTAADAAVSFVLYNRVMTDPTRPHCVFFDEGYAAFVIRPESAPVCVPLGPAKSIDEAIERWFADVRAARNDTASGTVVSDLLLDPVRRACGDATNWVVAADGAIEVLPLGTLPFHGAAFGETHRVTSVRTLSSMLVDRRPLETEPSLLSLGGLDYDVAAPRTRTDVATRDTVAAVRGLAGPEGTSAANGKPRVLGRLPKSLPESRDVADAFLAGFPKATAPTILTAADGTAERFIRESHSKRFIHIASHAWFTPPASDASGSSSPDSRRAQLDATAARLTPFLFCGVAFSGANASRGGVLTGDEICCLDLSGTELVVLSACRSGLGLRQAGAGLASLRNALGAAGARGSLTSAWEVSDDATRVLMARFTRNLWVEKLPAHEALRRAQRAIATEPNPDGTPRFATRDWGGWILSIDR